MFNTYSSCFPWIHSTKISPVQDIETIPSNPYLNEIEEMEKVFFSEQKKFPTLSFDELTTSGVIDLPSKPKTEPIVFTEPIACIEPTPKRKVPRNYKRKTNSGDVPYDSTSESKCTKSVKRQRRNKGTLLPNDGYQWRKYGQKVLMDSPYVRTYFSCTHKPKGCPVKKTVDRHNDDPTFLRVSYHGEHDHPSLISNPPLGLLTHSNTNLGGKDDPSVPLHPHPHPHPHPRPVHIPSTNFIRMKDSDNVCYMPHEHGHPSDDCKSLMASADTWLSQDWDELTPVQDGVEMKSEMLEMDKMKDVVTESALDCVSNILSFSDPENVKEEAEVNDDVSEITYASDLKFQGANMYSDRQILANDAMFFNFEDSWNACAKFDETNNDPSNFIGISSNSSIQSDLSIYSNLTSETSGINIWNFENENFINDDEFDHMNF